MLLTVTNSLLVLLVGARWVRARGGVGGRASRVQGGWGGRKQKILSSRPTALLTGQER